MATQPARGMRDFLPEDIRRRDYVVGVIRDVYDRYGFEPLETPAVENIDTLLGKYGDEGNKLIFKILKRGEHEATGQADLALRYDLTVPLARVVAEHQSELPKFFKRYQIQPVWRADRPARGRFREFYQCDIDVIGSTSVVVEVELIAAASEVLGRLGFEDFTVRLNDRRLLSAMLTMAGVGQSKQTSALIVLDKLDKIGIEAVADELGAQGIDSTAASKLLRFFARGQTDLPQEMIASLEGFLGSPDAIASIAKIWSLSESTSTAGHVRIDPSLARGLSYYTGAIMEIVVPDLVGSLGGGGRYDNLIGMFLGRDIPACGFSLGLERILVVMAERNMFPASLGRTSADVMVALWNEESQVDALRLANTLRASGLRVDVYPEADKLGKQFKYASGRNVHFVTVVGDDERASGTVTVKDLRSGLQEPVPREQVANYLKNRLSPV